MADCKLDDEIKSEETVLQHQQKVLVSDLKRRMNVNVENQFEIYEKLSELEKVRIIKNLEKNYCQKEDDEVIEKDGYVGWKNAKGITPYDINPELLKKYPSDDKS
ncbi:MAG: hypothetical protein IJJ71_06955 [Treponema sp.]|uniref:hypothetical protein n=1 Tax=Treponema sp. TaxID=166 RepID=UPI0025D4FD11|nr:hypothetical protein [Treponema sp.]MBR0495893.1 hypothetical protein [Treponema sp.]